MLAPQRAIREVKHAPNVPKPDKDAFIEECLVRRELSDNHCYYNDNYDSVRGFHAWAKKTLTEHEGDKRQYVYTQAQLEEAKSHDPLWNAAQMELVLHSK